MSVGFRNVTGAPLAGFEAAVPDGVVVGVIGERASGADRLLRMAAGLERPESGSVERSGAVRYIGPEDALDLSPVPLLVVDHAFARLDAVERERSFAALDRFRRAGGAALVASHEEELLRRIADEVWWLHEGRLAGRGDPAETLAAWRRHVAQRVRAWGESALPELAPRVRRGDGRAEVVSVELTGENGLPTGVLRSGEAAAVKVTVRFRDAVADPVIGIMIRTRIGLNVYGTNTELERLHFGPCRAGETVELGYSFRCDLCPEEYALTVASHDPEGVWHDWLEDAVAFTVGDSRYTAGVANLRAVATVLARR
jgi:energy-coupling factor transporter ATP-binding protein EcfA2